MALSVQYKHGSKPAVWTPNADLMAQQRGIDTTQPVAVWFPKLFAWITGRSSVRNLQVLGVRND